MFLDFSRAFQLTLGRSTKLPKKRAEFSLPKINNVREIQRSIYSNPGNFLERRLVAGPNILISQDPGDYRKLPIL